MSIYSQKKKTSYICLSGDLFTNGQFSDSNKKVNLCVGRWNRRTKNRMFKNAKIYAKKKNKKSRRESKKPGGTKLLNSIIHLEWMRTENINKQHLKLTCSKVTDRCRFLTYTTRSISYLHAAFAKELFVSICTLFVCTSSLHC